MRDVTKEETTGFKSNWGAESNLGIYIYILIPSHWLNDGIIKENRTALIYSTGIY